MDKMTFFASLPVIVWIVTEVVGKFLLPKMDKNVLAVVISVLTVLSSQYMGTDLSVFEKFVGGIAGGPMTGLLHDNLIEKLLILSKKEIEDKQK